MMSPLGETTPHSGSPVERLTCSRPAYLQLLMLTLAYVGDTRPRKEAGPWPPRCL